MEPDCRTVNLMFAGNGGGTPQGDHEVNVSQRIRGIKKDKKKQSCLIMLLMQLHETTPERRGSGSERICFG
jgi:hypothetical protein